jgi:hypothetical protein
MDKKTTIPIRSRLVTVSGDTKSDIARALLEKGFSVSEISKAVPMAYSQVHSIQKKRLQDANAGRPEPRAERGGEDRGPSSERRGQSSLAGRGQTPPRDGASRASNGPARQERSPQPTAAQARTRRPVAPPPPSPRVGKLKSGNAPSDIEVGECANCGFDLIVRRAPIAGRTVLLLVHVNITSDEYINTVQFCQAIPKRLLA